MTSKIAGRGARSATTAVALAAALGFAAPARAQDISLTTLMNEISGLTANLSNALKTQNQALISSISQQASSTLAAASSTLQTGDMLLAGAWTSFLITSAFTSLNMSMSCPVFEGDGTSLGEDNCAWTKLTGQRVTQSGITTDSAGLRAGGEKEIAPGWFLGGTLHAETSWMQMSTIANTGENFDGAATLKRVVGPWLFAGAMMVGTSATHTTRGASVGGTMQSDSNVFGGGLRLRGAYDIAFTGWYARPRLDLDAYYTNVAGIQEYGPDPTGLALNGYQKVNVAITPALELGGRIDMGGMILRPYVIGGAMFLPNNSATTNASFTGIAAQFGSVPIAINGPSVLGTAEAGLQLYRAHGFEVKADYMLSAGDSYLSQTIGLRGAYHF
jgi:hypothetical protein